MLLRNKKGEANKIVPFALNLKLKLIIIIIIYINVFKYILKKMMNIIRNLVFTQNIYIYIHTYISFKETFIYRTYLN